MANVENLRKQAKLYLRWHRERYWPVAAQIRGFLARFQNMPDSEILAAEFRLSDAQELVARKHGFDGWPALIKGANSMTEATPARGASVILSAEPQLPISDIGASCRFYVEKLGFALAFFYGEPPFYAQVYRDGARLNLRRVSGPAFDGGLRAREGDVLAATLTLDDPKPLFLDFQTAGVVFHRAVRTEPWGARTFIVADPDGSLICFAGSAGWPRRRTIKNCLQSGPQPERHESWTISPDGGRAVRAARENSSERKTALTGFGGGSRQRRKCNRRLVIHLSRVVSAPPEGQALTSGNCPFGK